MNHTEHLTYYVANFVDELVKCGIEDVVISPGSRSTPLALTFAEHSKIQHWVNLDERSAAFFALGMAKEQQKAVAILCTSGTAAANYYPAIVEAHLSQVPLVVLTADRPQELRDVGAPQAIDQIKMYGSFVKWYHEMAMPEAENQMLSYVRSIAARAVFEAENQNAGPVHLNFPFREPLVPDFTLPDLWQDSISGYHSYYPGNKVVSNVQVEAIIEQLENKKKGLIICGPQMDPTFRDSIFLLASKWNIPVLADPLSQLRAGEHDKSLLIEGYDSILKSKKVRDKVKPDFIIRFGAMPVSKPYLFFLKENRGVPHFVIEPDAGHREPTMTKTQFVYCDPHEFCHRFANYPMQMEQSWTSLWVTMNEIVRKQWENVSPTLTEGHAVTIMQRAMDNDHILFTGNSMPVRDVDTFFMSTNKDIKVFGNRGANGIDGIVSTAIGTASHGRKVTLLIGDLSFYHDLNGLLVANQYNIDITVVLINNNGGGIFSFLPQAEDKSHFEVLFGTPLNLSFEKVVDMYGGHYANITSWEHFEKELKLAYQTGGIHVLEINTNRDENVIWHREEWAIIEQNIVTLLG